MKICLINPSLVAYRGDPFGQIPSIPVGLLYVASSAQEAGHELKVIDGFSSGPNLRREWQREYECFGLLPGEIMELVDKDSELIGISSHSGMSHRFILELINKAKERKLKVVIGGAFASTVPKLFISAGADYVVIGEGEKTFAALISGIQKGDSSKISGLASSQGVVECKDWIEDLDGLPYPAFDLIDLSAYHGAGRAHGPLTGPYLPLISSRGCPYNCSFCATPGLSKRRWRSRSPESVIAEIKFLREKYGVFDFHIQDDNFTTSPERVMKICEGLERLSPRISFCLPSAVKVEEVTPELLEHMKRAGLRYISFSPESGSERVRGLMNKRVDPKLLLELIQKCHQEGIACQCCFVIGYPGEIKEDRDQTRRLFQDLVKKGADDISFFIMSPVPGSQSEGSLGEVNEYEGYNWSPRWRPDYEMLNRFRNRRYLEFFFLKTLHHPESMVSYARGIISGRYRTKGEMAIGWLIRSK